ncbi:hypothetical protein EI164_03910 [Psychrobacter sp. FME13]|nr:hypothetical protein [Psychrobacter sp. FME13]MBE0441211.1 hypothetical protein [Psychrobacter sp. FME13]
MFNDDAGFELVNLQAQRDLNSLIKNDERRHVNRDRSTIIDKDETVTVHGKRTEVVDKDETITIHQNRTEIVDKDETITIHNNRQERVDDNETIDIGGNRTETVHKSEQITIKGNRDKTVKGNDTLTVNKDRKETVNKSRSLTVDKTNTEFVKLGKSVTVGLGYATQVGTIMNTAVGIMQTEQIGRIKKSFVGKSYSITAGDEFKITVGKSSLVMNADGSIIITGSSIVTQAEKENKVIGKDVLINPPGASAGGGEYESNVMVDNYDKDGNLLGNYRLVDKPSDLTASIASPMPIPFPGALSVPRVPAGVRPYPFTNTYDLQNPKNPFGKRCQDLLKKISNLRESIAKRERELIEDKNNLPERGKNLRNWATKSGHRAIIRIEENYLRKREQEYDENCQILA